jgi:RNA polymerase sigma factor for flagellar operon FliA
MSTAHSLLPVAPETFSEEHVSGTFPREPAVPVSSVTSAELTAYMHLVRMTVARFLKRVPPSVQRDDLVAAGTIGLMDALAKHAGNGERGAEFEWYARVRIRGAILDELRQQDWLSRGARARAQDPSRTSIRPAVIGLDDLREGARDIESEDEESPLSIAEKNSERGALSEVVAQLPARERTIVEMHYARGMQMKEIAKEMGVSLPRVSQLHARAIGMLRGLMAANDVEGPATA